jgi:exonuclease III
MDHLLEAARHELFALSRTSLPDAAPGSAPWQALALRRDIHALRKDAPPHGLSELSKDLNTYKTFDKVLQQTLTLLDKQAAACAHALPFNAIYGPWEGGIDSRLPPKNTVPTTMPAFNLKIVSWNIRGALSTSSRQESHGGRMLQLVSTLHSLQVSLAVISDPCFGPGMRWPRWTGYEFFGQRTTKNNTVAILVAIEILHYVEVIPDVGDPRALWVQVHTSESDGPEFLLLAMYAPPSNYMPKERLDFFASRVTELCSLRSLPKFASLPLLLAGDLNIHMHEICEKNAELERPVDRDIAVLLRSSTGLNLALRNPADVATHDSGTAIDLVFSSPDFQPQVQVLSKELCSLTSDHRPLLITHVGSVSCQQKHQIGRAKWKPYSDEWGDALVSIPCCLSFICRWVELLLGDTFLRDSLVIGKWQKLRQAVVDKAVWWRSVVLCLAGHLRGLAVTVKPSPSGVNMSELSLDKFLLEWYGPQCHGDTIEFEEFLSNLGKAGCSTVVRRFLDCHASDPGRAQAILSMMINPKVATEICLVDGSSGDRASDSTIVHLLTQDVLERPQQAHPGDEVFTEAVNATLQDERAKAHTEAAQEPHMFFELEEVTRWIQNISIHKASLRFPRAAIHNDQPLGRRLCWLLLNLFLALGVVPSAWMREISFIRKRGPQIVTDFKNLRPISYTDELQTLFDLAWLQKCRSILEAYVGSEQSGGRYDSVLISLGILIALQTRRNLSLPTFCLKADLLQGYDLAWKSAILLHTRWAGIKGSLWLCLDSSLQQDTFRARYGPLVGPAALVLAAGLGQGGRRAVHLFGAMARGIPDQLRQRIIGIAIGSPWRLLNKLQVGSRSSGNVQPDLVATLVSLCRLGPDYGELPRSILNNVTVDTALLTLDVLATNTLLISQFVDDIFIFQSTM